MWALASGDTYRHDYGGGDPPVAICGHKGKYPIDFNSVNIPMCQGCLLLWPSYNKKRKEKEDGRNIRERQQTISGEILE